VFVKKAGMGANLIGVIDKHLQAWGRETRLEQAALA